MTEFKKQQFPPQHQNSRPDIESEMHPLPVFKKEGAAGCEN